MMSGILSNGAAELEGFVVTRLEEMGFELVDLRKYTAGRTQVLELFCERAGDEGITVDDCARISERMKYALEAEGFLGEDSSLIVSSPGLDRIIKHPADFKGFSGRMVKVYRAHSNGGVVVEGELSGFDDGVIKLNLGDGEVEDFKPGEYRLVRLVPDIGNIEKRGKEKNKKRYQNG